MPRLALGYVYAYTYEKMEFSMEDKEREFSVVFEVRLGGYGIREHADKMAVRARKVLEEAFKESVEIDSVRVEGLDARSTEELLKLRQDAEAVGEVFRAVTEGGPTGPRLGPISWRKEDDDFRIDTGLLMEPVDGHSILINSLRTPSDLVVFEESVFTILRK